MIRPHLPALSVHSDCPIGHACPGCARRYRRRHAINLATLAVAFAAVVWIVIWPAVTR